MEKITHDPGRGRFELKVDGCTAYVHYIVSDGALNVVSTRVPVELEGAGIASALTKHLLDYARQNRLRVIPTCSFTSAYLRLPPPTSAYLRRHPEYRDLSD